MKSTPLLLTWSWRKASDTRKPVIAGLLIEKDTDDGPVLMEIMLTPEQTSLLLSGSVVRTTGTVDETVAEAVESPQEEPHQLVKGSLTWECTCGMWSMPTYTKFASDVLDSHRRHVEIREEHLITAGQEHLAEPTEIGAMVRSERAVYRRVHASNHRRWMGMHNAILVAWSDITDPRPLTRDEQAAWQKVANHS